MAVTVDADGSLSTTIGTEHTLRDTASSGVYQLDVDLNAMAAGDVVELRVYKMVRASGTRRVIYEETFSGAQPADALIATSFPVGTPLSDSGAVRATLKQTFGTSRTFPWSLNKVA